MILTMNYTIAGVPMVYSGNELADTARLSMFANRFHMGVFEVTDRNAKGADVDRRKKVIKELNALRANCEILQNGKTKWYNTDLDRVLHFSRISDKGIITFIGNFGSEEIEIALDEKAENLLSNNACLQNGAWKLSKYGYMIFREK